MRIVLKLFMNKMIQIYYNTGKKRIRAAMVAGPGVDENVVNCWPEAFPCFN